MASTSASPEASNFHHYLKTSENGSIYHIEGQRIIEVSWVENNIVSRNVGDQGNCSSCWAWTAVKATEAAMKIKGITRRDLSVQEIIDNSYREKRGCCGGQVITAFDWIKKNGLGLESKSPYTGRKAKIPKPLSKERYFIDDWRLIKDNEKKMEKALKTQPLVVTIPYVSSVLGYENGFLDLVRAEEVHDKDRFPDLFQKSHREEGHNVLLVEKGYIIPHNQPDVKIDFWVILNQWKKTWGNKGFADILLNSSIAKLKRLQGIEDKVSDWSFAPVVPIVKASKDDVIDEVDIVRKDMSMERLLDVVANKPKTGLIILLYCKEHTVTRPDLLEEFRNLSRVYEYDENVLLSRLDVSSQPSKMFSVRVGRKPVLLTFSPTDQRRLVEDGKMLHIDLKAESPFGIMLSWLEGIIGSAV